MRALDNLPNAAIMRQHGIKAPGPRTMATAIASECGARRVIPGNGDARCKSSSKIERDARRITERHHEVNPGEIAIGVIIGRTSEFFDFFVYAIASVIVFPKLVFPYRRSADRHALLVRASSRSPSSRGRSARPSSRQSTAPMARGAKLTIALFLLGTSTVAIAFLPGYEQIGSASAWLLALFRIGQGWRLAAPGTGLPRCWR